MRTEVCERDAFVRGLEEELQGLRALQDELKVQDTARAREREREQERESERERESEGEGKRGRERERVCVCGSGGSRPLRRGLRMHVYVSKNCVRA
jgi:hypothetical protein